MTAAGIEVEPDMIQVSSFDGKMAFEQSSALLRRTHPPSAVIAGNDSIALGVIEAARCAGLAVPRDLSVVGFDDIPAATLVTPNLTTVHQPLVDIGEKAVALLVERTNPSGEVNDNTCLLAPQLVVRGSSGAVPRVRSHRRTSAA
jgi:DNA-binding LacI/PurR family transcriptional regulator